MADSTKFTWNDPVRIRIDAAEGPNVRPGAFGWVVGMSRQEERSGYFLEEFPEGAVYTVEYEDGTDATIPEAMLLSEAP
jgi:hypothetical protein